ncbi:acyl-CoA dehydrogenase [Plantibacter sp. Mn2098]|uniref:acyl-CoA dehydrogenase n=1 Tax=Plantibacter sp. Mn2098 TaxID=3395266 RepID=UPI003BD18744
MTRIDDHHVGTGADGRVALPPSVRTHWTREADEAFDSAPPSGAPPEAVLAWAAGVAAVVPLPASGRTSARWEFLASIAALDVANARMLEPHLDAMAILAEAAEHDAPIAVAESSTWGVFASEGPASTVSAVPSGSEWILDGTKPWCSLGAVLSHALVTAATGGGGRRLFAVDLRQPGVTAHRGPWVARGLAEVVSAPITFSNARAEPVGPDGWYLRRPGFAWGGIGVAVCWWGAAIGIARALADAAERRAPDQLGEAALGFVDRNLHVAGASISDAAFVVDEALRDPDAPSPSVVSKRTRNIVAAAAAAVTDRVVATLGPGPTTTDETFAKRVADLQLYLAQHHGERDDASLGRAITGTGRRPW